MTSEAKESTKKWQSKRVLLVQRKQGSEVSFAHLGTDEDMLVANNTDLNDRSTTSLAGT